MLKSAIILVIFVYLSNGLGGIEHEYPEHEYPEHGEHEGYEHEGYEHEGYEHEGYPAAVHNEAYQNHGGEFEHGEYEHEDHYNQGGAYNQGASHTGANTGYNYGPRGNMVIHSPNAQGFSMVYDVSSPNRAGSFYYYVKEGTLKPSLNDLRMGTGATCANRFPQVDDKMTTKNIPCTLQIGKQYMVWCATDSDSNGRDADFCNEGAGELLNTSSTNAGVLPTGHGTTPQGHGTTPVSGHGTGTLPAGHGMNPNSPIPRYRLVLGGHTCDYEEKAMQFVKMLRITSMNDIEGCARAVSMDVECGQTFYGGGLGGTCGCVRKTAEATQNQGAMGVKFKACDEEESESGDGIYTFTPANGVILQSSNLVPEARTSGQTGFGMFEMIIAVIATFCFTVCCLGSIYAAYQYGKKEQQSVLTDGAYSIYLDEEEKSRK